MGSLEIGFNLLSGNGSRGGDFGSARFRNVSISSNAPEIFSADGFVFAYSASA